MSKLEEADKIFKEMLKDEGGKIILAFVFSCLFLPKDTFEEFMEKYSKEKENG